MEQQKVRNYILYAIGEIALVMIGILLALQVNNWNEERQEKLKEQSYLVELERDFEQVLDRATFGMDQYKMNIEAMYRLRESMDLLHNTDTKLLPTTLDSLSQDLGRFAVGRVPAGVAPSYSEMKSSGLLVILQNKQLSFRLAQYDELARVSAEAFRTLRDQLLPALHHMLKYSNATVDLDADLSRALLTQNAFIEDFLKDKETSGAISTAISVNGNMYSVHESQADIAKEILALIKGEIKKSA